MCEYYVYIQKLPQNFSVGADQRDHMIYFLFHFISTKAVIPVKQTAIAIANHV